MREPARSLLGTIGFSLGQIGLCLGMAFLGALAGATILNIGAFLFALLRAGNEGPAMMPLMVLFEIAWMTVLALVVSLPVAFILRAILFLGALRRRRRRFVLCAIALSALAPAIGLWVYALIQGQGASLLPAMAPLALILSVVAALSAAIVAPLFHKLATRPRTGAPLERQRVA